MVLASNHATPRKIANNKLLFGSCCSVYIAELCLLKYFFNKIAIILKITLVHTKQNLSVFETKRSKSVNACKNLLKSVAKKLGPDKQIW